MDSIMPRTNISSLFFTGLNLITLLEAWLNACSWYRGMRV
jgi:hypothetical protein